MRSGDLRRSPAGSRHRQILRQKSRVYHALSDPLRLTILYLIKDQPLCVCVINRFTRLSGSKLSYHLNILKESGLIEGEYHGNWIIYSLTDTGRKYRQLILLFTGRPGIPAQPRQQRSRSRRARWAAYNFSPRS